MKHACLDCKYHYIYTGEEKKMVYSSLTDSIESVSVEKEYNACGYSPGGVILDDNAPHCSHFKKQDWK